MWIPTLAEVLQVWSDPAMVAFFLGIVTVMLGMYVTARAARTVDESEYQNTRERLGTDFAVIVMLTTQSMFGPPDTRLLVAVISLVGVYVVGSTAYRVTHLRKRGMPVRYVRHVVAGGALELAGMSTFFATRAGWIG